jgi:hypothetical protein
MELKPYYHSYFGRIVNDVEKCRIENTGGDLMTEILIMGCVRMRNKMIEMMPALGMFCPIFPCHENEKEMQTKLSQKMVDRVLVKDRHMVGIQGLNAQDTTLAFFIFSLGWFNVVDSSMPYLALITVKFVSIVDSNTVRFFVNWSIRFSIVLLLAVFESFNAFFPITCYYYYYYYYYYKYYYYYYQLLLLLL